MGRQWNGDAWRWDVRQMSYRGHGLGRSTIAVIEKPVEEGAEPKKGRKVPFGFGPRDHAPEPVEMPQLWEGDDA